MGKRYIVMVLYLISASCGFGAAPVTVEVVEVSRIWDKAPHNAFTDLVRWQDAFYCTFREGRGHVSTDGRIRILESKDADTWTSVALISLESYDLRDAHLSVAPDGRLMLLGGAAPREKDNQSAPTGTFVSFSKDGRQWTEPQIAVQPGRWLWCVTWHKSRAYGISYTAGKGNDLYLDLLVSDDGIHYEPHVPKLFDKGYPTEVTLRFDSEGTCYALIRRDRRGDDPSSALLGISRADYKQWQWKDLGSEFNGFGGPNFIEIPGGFWLAAGRMHDGGAHTAITYLDVENGAMTKLAKLPSGGDTSYPGMVWHNNMLYVSYYSSHEGKTSIYLAKLKITSKSSGQKLQTTPAKSFLDAKAILAGWENSYGNIRSMRISYSNQLVDYKPPANNPNEPPPVKYEHVERVEKENRFHIRLSTDEDAFDRPQNLREHAFDGEITREYSAIEKYGTIVAGLIGRNTETMNNLKEYMLLRRRLKGGRNASGTYLIEDPNSKPQLSSTLSSAIIDGTVSVRPVLESVAGRLCHVVEVVVPGRVPRQIKQVFWMAHDNGMCLMKYQWYWDDTLEREIEVEQIVMTKMEGTDVWYPKKAYKTIFAEEVFGTAKYELTVFDFVPNVEVDENTFRFDFPPGTDVMDKIRGISGVDLPKEPPSLAGKPLPSLDDLNIELGADHVKDKMILVCFWDMQQRPSRNCITQLTEQAEQLKEKGVAVVAIHASNVDENTLNEWMKENKINFPVDIIRSDEKKTRFNWGIKSLPWLILTDREHVVTAEGFGVDEINSLIDEITKHVSSTRKISGLVSAINGDTQEGVEIKIVPAQSGLSSSNAKGRFVLEYQPKMDAGPETDYYLSARHEARNLAAFQLVDENIKSVELRLDPAVTLTGMVVNTEGRYVANAEVRVLVRGANWKGSITFDTTQTDVNGFFRFKAISTELPISNVIVTAKGYCQHFINGVNIQYAENDIKLKTITLHEASLSVSGVVVDVNDQPVSDAIVKMLGSGEPRTDTITDSEGRFKVDKLGPGGIRIIAKRSGDIPLEGFVNSQAGATDVKVKVTEIYESPRFPKSKVGKSLSEINDLKISFNTEILKDAVILLCFFNYEQRPSRNCIIRLAEQEEKLKHKGVAVVGIQSSKVDNNMLHEWVKKNDIPFPIRMIQNDEEKTRFTWGVKSLPWLILTDRKHVITAEGFGLDELEDKIRKVKDTQ